MTCTHPQSDLMVGIAIAEVIMGATGEVAGSRRYQIAGSRSVYRAFKWCRLCGALQLDDGSGMKWIVPMVAV
jgi:hypothetical protein